MSITSKKDLVDISARFFILEIHTNYEGKNVRLSKLQGGFQVSIIRGGEEAFVSPYLISGLPNSEKNITEVFFKSCYAKIACLDTGEYKVYFLHRINGGGNGQSTNRQGAEITRATQRARAGVFLTGTNRTQQQIRDEIREIFIQINTQCEQSIQKIHNLDPLPEPNLYEWKSLDQKIDIACKEKSVSSVLNNIEERVEIIKLRRSVVSDYSIKLQSFIGLFSSNLNQIREKIEKINIKKMEIEEIQRNQSMISFAVNTLAVSLDGFILDPLLGCKEGTSVWHFLQGYDCMGRPPASLEELDGWINSAEQLESDLIIRRSGIESSITYHDNLIYDLHALQIQISSKKIDALTVEMNQINTIVSKCKQLYLK